MQYILIDNLRRNNAIEYIQLLDITKLYEIIVRPYKKNRSVAQNRLMWDWVEVMADYCGYTKEAMHKELKVKFLGVTEEMIAGELIREPKSTTELNTKEFTDYLREIEILAGEYGVVLPRPDDMAYAMGRE